MLMSSSIDIDATIITLGFFYDFSLSLTFSTFNKAYLGMNFLPFSVLVVHVLDFSTLVSLRHFLAFSRQISFSAALPSPL